MRACNWPPAPHSALRVPHSEFRIPHSASRIPHSASRIPHSAFRIPHSAFRIPHSAFRIPHSAFRQLAPPRVAVFKFEFGLGFGFAEGPAWTPKAGRSGACLVTINKEAGLGKVGRFGGDSGGGARPPGAVITTGR